MINLEKKDKEVYSNIKEAAKKAVKSKDAEKAMDISLDKKTRKEVVKNLNNPVKTEKIIENRDEPKSKKGRMASGFTKALLDHLPFMIGSTLGGVEIGAAAQEGYQGVRDREAAQAEVQRKAGLEERGMQVKERQQDRLSSPDAMSEFQKQSLDLRRKQLEQTDIAEKRRQEGLGLRKEQHGLDIDKFGLTEQKAAQLSDVQVKDLKAVEETIQGLNNLDKLKSKVDTGPIASRLQSGAELIGQADEQFTLLKSEAENTVAKYIQAISGAQASELEVQRLKRVAPTINDDDKTFKAKSKAFRKIVSRSKKSITDAIKSGQPLKEGTINKMIDEEFGSNTGKEETPRQRLERLRAKHGIK